MKICPKCRAEVENNLDVCWSCNYSFVQNKTLAFEEEAEKFSGRKVNCLRCNTPMRFVGSKSFHEGANWGALGNLFELFEAKTYFDLYVCPKCGKVEFFIPVR